MATRRQVFLGVLSLSTAMPKQAHANTKARQLHPSMKTILKDGAPSSIRSFKLPEPMITTPYHVPGMEYLLSCIKCSATRFTVLTFSRIAPDPSPYADIKSGEVFYLPPHFARCKACGHEAKIFDARTDGYDAVVNNIADYESGTGDPVELPGSRTIRVSYLYNIDLREMEQAAAEVHALIVDLYDSMGIEALSDGADPPFIEGYELA